MRFDSLDPGFFGSIARSLINLQAITRFTILELIVLVIILILILL